MSKRKMNNKNVTTENGDVFNGDKLETTNITTINETTIINNYFNDVGDVQKNYEVLTLKNDFNDFYKRYIMKFEELKDYAFSLLFPIFVKKEYKFTSNNLIFGKKIIDWVYGLGEFPNKEIMNFYNNLKFDFNFEENSIIVKRWNSNIPYFNGDLLLAKQKYEILLSDMENQKNIPSWFKDDILIDGRNISIQYENSINNHTIKNVFQLKLDLNNHKLSYPDVDRIKTEIFEKANSHIFNNKNKSKNTTIYGVGLEEMFNQVQDLIYLAIFYGSITHLKLARELIANIMYMYADTFEDEKFYNLTLKMLALASEQKKYKILYDKIKLNCDFVNSEIFINSLLECKKSLLSFEQNRFDIFIYDLYGRYISDKYYIDLERKILNIVEINDDYQIMLIEGAFKSIVSNIKRFNDIDKLLNIIYNYIIKKYTRFYINFGNILNEIDVEKLSRNNYELFKSIIDLILQLDDRTSINISYAIIKIKKRSPRIKKYDDLINKENSFENLVYNISKGTNRFSVLSYIINEFKRRYEDREKSPSIIKGYGTDYTIGTDFFSNKYYNQNIRNLIIKDYLPLAKSILLSKNQLTYIKIKHIKTLASILMIEHDAKIKKDIVNFVNQSENIENGDIFEEHLKKCENDLKVNIIMIDYICKKINCNELLYCYTDMAIKDKTVIEEILSCIEILKKDININNKGIIDLLHHLFILFYDVNDIDIRNKVVFMSEIFINTKYHTEIMELLNDRINKITFSECKGYINLIREISPRKRIYFDEIMNNLKKNRNFYVRYMFNKYLKSL